MSYYGKFWILSSIGEFTTEWQRPEVCIAAGCMVLVILFVVVTEMLLKSTNCEETNTKTSLRAFMDDITVCQIIERHQTQFQTD